MTIQIFCPIGFQNVLADNYEKQITILLPRHARQFLPLKPKMVKLLNWVVMLGYNRLLIVKSKRMLNYCSS